MKWEAWLPHVLQYAPGCPSDVAIDHVIKAARMFCAKTLAWNFQTEPVLTAIDGVIYPLDLDDGQELVKIIDASIDGRQIGVQEARAGRLAARGQRGGSFVWIEGLLDIGMYPAPRTADQSIVLQVAVKPTLDAAEWPDELSAYVDDIAHGAAATLCMLPKVEWSDKDTAQTQAAMFVARVGSVAYSTSRGYSSGRYSVGRRFL